MTEGDGEAVATEVGEGKRAPLTEFANLAVTELFQMRFVCRSFTNRVAADEHELMESNAKHPALPPRTNGPFNDAASNFLGCLQLCRSVDLYNWYCRECLKLALQSDPKSVISEIKSRSTGSKDAPVAEAVAKAEKNGKDAAAEVLQQLLANKFRQDKGIRDTVHQYLRVIQDPEVELVCMSRNAVVHRRGRDEGGEIANAICSLGSDRSLIGVDGFPDGHMPIAIGVDGYLVMSSDVGSWAAALLEGQIFRMDQNFAYRYKLPRKVWAANRMTLRGPYQSFRMPMGPADQCAGMLR